MLKSVFGLLLSFFLFNVHKCGMATLLEKRNVFLYCNSFCRIAHPFYAYLCCIFWLVLSVISSCRWLRFLSGWERSGLPIRGHQGLWHYQAADQRVVRSGPLGPAPQPPVNLLKLTEVKACQVVFVQLSCWTWVGQSKSSVLRKGNNNNNINK